MEKIALLGTRLKQLMDERNLNYERLGLLLEMRPQTLNRYVLGQREPKARVATDMAMKLQVDPLWLQGFDVPRNRTSIPTPSSEVMLPVLERYCADLPTLEQQKIVRYMSADVDNGAEYFYLLAEGDSMKNAGIQAGDCVLIHRQQEAENGQIAACIIEQEDATLKRFCRQGDWVILQPEHPGYSPHIVPVSDFAAGRARIVGVAVRLVRDL